MSFEKTKMEVTGMKLKELLKKIDNREMLNIYNKEKFLTKRMNLPVRREEEKKKRDGRNRCTTNS